MNQNIKAVLEAEIEQMEVLLDDLSEFSKGCTDAQQSQIGYTLDIIQDYIANLSEKIDNLD